MIEAKEDETGTIVVTANGNYLAMFCKDNKKFPDDLAAGLELFANSEVKVKPYEKEKE